MAKGDQMMRKYIIGALVGFLLSVPFSTFGATVSMIGKAVKNEYSVIVDGKTLNKKAIAIDGTSYAPLRVIADTIGYDIAFTNNTVVMSNPSMEGSDNVGTGTDAGTTPDTHYFTLETIQAAINDKKADIVLVETNIHSLENNGASQEKIDELKAGLTKMQQELTRLETIKAGLEAQASAPTATP